MPFDTPKSRRAAGSSEPKFTDEARATLLANFDLEIESRLAKIRGRLAEDLVDFKRRHAQHLNNIPRALRTVTIDTFAIKYEGSIARFMEEQTRVKQAEGLSVDIEASARKRKQPTENAGDGPSKASKAARMAPLSPAKLSAGDATPTARRVIPGNAGRTPTSKLLGTISKARFATGPTQPQLQEQPITGPSRPRIPQPNSRSNSPSKPSLIRSTFRVPSATEFNPSMPPKTPGYPPRPRPVKDTDVLMSANGSPLANPWILKSFGSSGEQLIRTSVPAGDEGTENSVSLNSPPPSNGDGSRKPQRIISGVFSLKTSSGATLDLDPNMSPGKNEEFVGLTDSAKKVVKDSVLKLAMRYAGMKVGS
ncbi:hypothetical protein FRB96_000935 [Tulasnella sp. 330]|nr:hypothetical protein FRB96_000935 [Tulasnella sp. 330]KAG8871152.1 hypothetical protein FRB97_008960 [Tulasnella sp. 331]